MSEVNKSVALKFIDALGRGDVDAVKPLLAEDMLAVAKGTSLGSGTRTRADVIEVFGMFGQITKTGLNPKIVSVSADGDRVAVEWEGNCTLVTGQPYNNQYCMVFTLRDGKIRNVNEYFDTKLADAALGPIFAPAGQNKT
jgi:uncharacterized protein